MTTVLTEPGLTGLLAPNPGPMTLEGTNTWVVGQPTAGPTLVVDPGPDDEDHLRAVLRAAGGQLSTIVLTHRHPDHADGARRLADWAGCGVRAVDPALRVGAPGLLDGDRIAAGGWVLDVLPTPGHTDDSVSLLLQGDPTGLEGGTQLLTGDTVLGRGTTVIADPDGDLEVYLASLERLREVIGTRAVRRILPGHGPVIDRPAEVLEAYLAHRYERLEQVRQAVRAGAATAADVVAIVYADVDRALWAAAEQSVRAQLRYLEEHG
jgi:glyoxylase-like metal-dependent hydrolase (beta-lactamase superfamily II)